MKPRPYILPLIVIAQFCGTSLWFASNGILQELTRTFLLPVNAVAHLTTVVQIGFITGTLVFAIFSIADRFAASKVFFICATLGALSNLMMVWDGNSYFSLLVVRGFTGFFLAGIYPVGMKIAADYYKAGLGRSLGFLVGALVLGTALPHALQSVSFEDSWRQITYMISGLAFFGGLLLWLGVPNGPLRTKMNQWSYTSFFTVFKNSNFRKAAFGYFGHMWELYAFWTFIPILLLGYAEANPETSMNVSLWSFIIIAAGAVGCMLGGSISKRYGVKKIAYGSLSASALFCLISPLIFYTPPSVFLGCLVLWGLLVVADSPMFSTMVALEVNPEYKATALTIVNCIGFAITIVSIQLLSVLREQVEVPFLFLALGIGPLIGIAISFRRKPRDA